MKEAPHVNIAEFKAHLSRHLGAVRKGHEVVISDRGRPIARVVPYSDAGRPALNIVKARSPGGFKKLKFKRLLSPGVDPLEFLMADRRKGRER